MGSVPHKSVLVAVPKRRFGMAYVDGKEVAAIVCFRIKNNVEEYLVEWESSAPPNRLQYSWHPIHELAGKDGIDNDFTGSALIHLQRYIEGLRALKDPEPARVPSKRKAPEDGPLHSRRQLSPFDHLSASRSPSVFSALSDNSSRISSEDEEPDTYNCTLEVKDGLIRAKLSSVPPTNTTIFPTKSMKDRAIELRRYTKSADEKIRSEFVRGLKRIKGAKPVKLINTTDSSTPLLSFHFIDGYQYSCGIEPQVPEAMEGCRSCRPNMGGFCGCEYTKICECLEFARVDERKLDPAQKRQYDRYMAGKGGDTVGLPKRFPYSKETGRLVTFYLESEFAIFECNQNCNCGKVCKSRVVQNGRQVGLEIFRTKDHRGWGLRCTEPLETGQFIDTYLGEVITKKEADKRSAKGLKGKDSYLFKLDKFQDDIPDDPFEIDGEFVGGPSRFINHSCDPNCAVYAVCQDKNDLYRYDLAFFALRYIKMGEELTFDYLASSDEADGEEEAPSSSQKDPPIPCLCGSDNCRGILWK